jgi:CMP-N-acetylneuraminic acid synthetase
VQFKRQEVHSIRAVQPAKEHPGKQWFIENGCLKPVLDWRHVDTKQPWHSMPTQTLAPAFTQNSSLEMAWTYAVRSFGTISGTKIAPFYTRGPEGLAIDTEDDWTMVYQLAERRPELLPKVTV